MSPTLSSRSAPLSLLLADALHDGPENPSSCDDHDRERDQKLVLGSLAVFAGLRIWEIIDAIATPGEHNRKVRSLRALSGRHPYARQLSPYLVPSVDGSGAAAGLSARF